MMRGWTALCVVCVATAAASAHDLAQSESVCIAAGASVACTLTLDLLEFPGVDADRNQRVSYAELDRSIAAVFAQVKTRVAVSGDQPLERVTLDRHELIEDHVLRMELTYAFAATVGQLAVTSTLDQLGRPEHLHRVVVGTGADRQEAVLDRTHPSVTLPVAPRRVTLPRVLAVAGAGLVVGLLAIARRRGRRAKGHERTTPSA